jgi:hypothetical protein
MDGTMTRPHAADGPAGGASAPGRPACKYFEAAEQRFSLPVRGASCAASDESGENAAKAAISLLSSVPEARRIHTPLRDVVQIGFVPDAGTETAETLAALSKKEVGGMSPWAIADAGGARRSPERDRRAMWSGEEPAP